MSKDKCNRCGKCCGNCQWLIRYLDGKTRCAIYKIRLGSVTGEVIGMGDSVGFKVCGKREDKHVNFPGCPYNRPEWGNVDGG